MAKRLKRNMTKRNTTKRNMTKRIKRIKTKRLKRKIRHKKRTQTIRRIYRGGVDAITSTSDLQKFLNDIIIDQLKPGNKVTFQVYKNGNFLKDTNNIVEVNDYIKSHDYKVYGMIEGND